MTTIVCVGGGPSVTAADLARVAKAQLDGHCLTIAINDSVYGAWWAHWLYAADSKWWLANIQRVQHFEGHKLTSANDLPKPWGVDTLRVTGFVGLDTDKACVRSGRGSGYQALHYAIQRAERVLLLGYDMAGAHWHGGYPNEPACDYGATMLPAFESLVGPAKQRCVQVVNCSAESMLQCFPKMPLAEALQPGPIGAAALA